GPQGRAPVFIGGIYFRALIEQKSSRLQIVVKNGHQEGRRATSIGLIEMRSGGNHVLENFQISFTGGIQQGSHPPRRWKLGALTDTPPSGPPPAGATLSFRRRRTYARSQVHIRAPRNQ